MSKIKLSALGGIGEHGKYMFLIEVDERIFILDAGLKNPEIDFYGLDAIIPDISYLLENKNRVEAIFISHGHEENIGALPYILQNINLRVYGSHFTISLIEDLLTNNEMEISKYKLYRINDTKILNFGNIKVSFFSTTHSIPETLGIAVHTEDGIIVYAPDFNFSKSLNYKYKTSFTNITDLGKQKVLAVMSESLGITDYGRATTNVMFEHDYRTALSKAQGRVIVSLYSTDLSRIQKIIDMSINAGKKVAVMSRQGERIIAVAQKAGYLKVPSNNLVTLDLLANGATNDDDNLVVVISGARLEPYDTLMRMLTNKNEYIQLHNQDTVVIVSDPILGTEKFASETIDELYRQDVNVVLIENKDIRTSHATSEDLMLLYSMILPKYIVPIIGEYRHQFRHINLLKENNYQENSIIVIDNGKSAVFENGLFTNYEDIPSGDIYVDGSLTGSVNEAVMKEREMMADSGAIVFTGYIDMKSKSLKFGPFVNMRGFVGINNLDDWAPRAKTLFTEMLNNALKKPNFNNKMTSESINNELSKLIYRQYKKKPVIIVALIELKK